ncbi:MAG: alpha-amylase [Phycisphaerae bacterium]|nr:alpha-amylase [Phycisphaerae bacterium]
MSYTETLLNQTRPASLLAIPRPAGESVYPSPSDWRDEVLYFLLPDRFSDAGEDGRPLLDRHHREAARPVPSHAQTWRWDLWARSGAERWQGGTLRGIRSKLDYLKELGVTALWIGPVFKQRGNLNTYHGYGIQDFLDVDPHLGTRQDLVDLVAAAHAKELRIILDIIFNHSGANFDYRVNDQRVRQPAFLPWPDFYHAIAWSGPDEQPLDAVHEPDDGVWPKELQDPACYTRAGTGNLGKGSIEDDHAEHKRTDFFDLRDFNLDPAPGGNGPDTLNLLAQCYKYWIALTDCDGFRIDTLKHVSFESGRNFCGAIKEFAARLGKHDFFLAGEVAGGDRNQDRYLDVLGLNLNATLDIGEMRPTLTQVAKGLVCPVAYFDGFDPGKAVMGSHRNLGRHHVSILDDHDHVFGAKVRFSSDSASDHQVAVGSAIQLFTLGIPCIYYGSEQALAGPETSQRHYLPDWAGSDRYLREAMFGPEHPRRAGKAGLVSGPEGVDTDLPGFGPFGTAGQHCFDAQSPAYLRIAAMNATRKEHPVLRCGRQYLRPTAFLNRGFGVHGPGEILAWSRILDDEEALCIVNTHGAEARGADVTVDPGLNKPGSAMTVVLNTAQSGHVAPDNLYPVRSKVPVQRAPNGRAYVAIRGLPASEVLVLKNHA